MVTASFQDRIRERAYELWTAGGRLDGQADQHWLAAESELLNEIAGEITSVKTASPARSPRKPRSRANGATRRRKTVNEG